MATAKAHGMLIEPEDVLAAALPITRLADSPNGLEYIGRIEILVVGAAGDLTCTTYGGVAQTYDDLAAGQVIDGQFFSIDSANDLTSIRVWWLSAP
jgi:hypothetical protein